MQGFFATLLLGLPLLAAAAPTLDISPRENLLEKRGDFTCERPFDPDTLHRDDCNKDCVVNMVEYWNDIVAGLDRDRFDFSIDYKDGSANSVFKIQQVQDILSGVLSGHGGSRIGCWYIGDDPQEGKTNQGRCDISYARGIGPNEAETTRKTSLDGWMDSTNCGTGSPDW